MKPLFLVLSLVILAGCRAPSSPQAVERYEGWGGDQRAQALFESCKSGRGAEDLPSTIELLRSLHARFPNHIPLHREYQDRMMEAGQREFVVQEYSDRMERARNPASLYLYARLDPENASSERLLKEAVDREGDFYWGYFALGVIKKEQGNTDAAVNYFERSREIHPGFAPAFWQLAEVNSTNNPELAIDDYKRFLTLYPKDIRGRINLGLLYLERGDLSSAENQFEYALELNPRSKDALYALGKLALLQNEPQEAIGFYQRILSLDPAESRARLNIGLVFEQQVKDLPRALEQYELFYRETQEKSGYASERIRAKAWIQALREKLKLPASELISP